jgi:L-fucose isomerase-like protein
MQILMDEKPLDGEADAARFIDEVKRSEPDGLLLIPFKKGHWGRVKRIIEETKMPTVVLATLGVLLVGHINQLHRKKGVYMISSLEDLDAVEYGMKMIRTSRRMKESRIINIDGPEVKTELVPVLGTEIRTIPHERFYEQFRKTEATEAVKKLARAYRKNAKEVVEPSKADILEAAKAYFALKRVVEAEEADAVMMNCLPGLKRPHQHVPPCMGFMSLRDEGIPAGCQSDLDSTVTLLLVQELFDKPGFQQNASMNTEKNLYFGAHCTSASKMHGVNSPGEPYALRNHAEAGWGCVPRVLFSKGQEVTLTEYHVAEKPHMLIYSGEVVSCPPIPPTGGCRSNIEMTINEVDDVCDVKGMHQIIFYGNYAKQLRAFCQLYGIEAVT